MSLEYVTRALTIGYSFEDVLFMNVLKKILHSYSFAFIVVINILKLALRSSVSCYTNNLYHVYSKQDKWFCQFCDESRIKTGDNRSMRKAIN